MWLVRCAASERNSPGWCNGWSGNCSNGETALVHLDATMRLFDPDIRPEAIRPRPRRNHNAWFRPNECRRLLYDVLRDAPTPPSTRELTEQLIALKAIPATDDRQRSLVQKTILGSLNAAKDTIERVELAGVVRWRLR